MTSPRSASPEIETRTEERPCVDCGTVVQHDVRYLRPAMPGARALRAPVEEAPRCDHCKPLHEQKMQKALEEVERRRREYQEARERERRNSRAYDLAEMLPRRYHSARMDQLNDALREALASWAQSPTGLYLYGPPGTGKTHAAAALLHAAWWHEHPERDDWRLSWAMWANTALLLEGLRRAMRSKNPETEEQIDNLCRTPLAVLDDLGSEKPSEWVADRLYVVIQHRYDNDLPIVVTSNLSVGEIGDRIGARIASRLVEMCQQIELGGPDRRLGAA